MKTFIIFSMALVASNAFFLPRDFFEDISHRFMDLHTAVRPQQGQFSHRPHPPFLPETTNDATHQRMVDLFDSLKPEEQAALKNHLFGERFPRPMPATHSEGHSKFSDEQIAAARDKWEAMTPEERKAFREKHANDEKTKYFHHQHMSDEKLEEIRKRWEAMTPEEREEIKNGHKQHFEAHEIPFEKPLTRSARSIQAIQPLGPEMIDRPLVRNPRQVHSIRPLPEMMDSPPLVRNPRQLQQIRPLPEINERPSIRPAHHSANQPQMSDEKLQEIRARWEAMTPEEREEVKNGKRKHYKANEIPFEKPLLRSPRSIQAIQPLGPEMNDRSLVRNPRQIQQIKPLPEMIENDRPLVRNPRQLQQIKPLPEMIDSPPLVRNPRPLQGVQTLPEGRPGFIQVQPYNVVLNPKSDYAEMMEKLKGMSAEDQIKFILKLYPEGMPIRPLKQIIDPAYGHDVKMPIQPAAHADEMKIQPLIFPLETLPLLPLEIQPIFPIPRQVLERWGAANDGEDDEKEIEDKDNGDEEPQFMPY